MNGPEHYARSQAILNGGVKFGSTEVALQHALIHAILALTAATVDGSEEIGAMAGVFAKWSAVGATGFDG